MKQTIKDIIVRILYLDSADEIKDDASLFIDFNFSSIDFIDLCFELKRVFSIDFSHADLWPIDNMEQNEAYFQDGLWTHQGWKIIADTLDLSATEALSREELYQYFNVNYIEKRLGVLAS